MWGHRSAVKRITFTGYTHFSHNLLLFLHLSHVPRPLPFRLSPEHNELLVLSIPTIRRNRRLLFLFLQPSALGPVARTFPKLSAQTFSSFISPSPSSIGTSVAQDTRHLSFSRHPHLCRFDPSTPIPNGTDACRTFRALITILDVPVRLPADTPEIVPGPYQPARICACLARLVDPRSERLEIFIDSGPPFRSGTGNRGGVRAGSPGRRQV